MNCAHQWICRSGYWRNALAGGLLPWALAGVDLGAEVLELGPGYGAATSILSSGVDRLTCVEIDNVLARALPRAGANVRVVQADAVRLPFPDQCFSAAVCFTMLHHVSPKERQDLLLAEVARVLRPGGAFVGTDGYRGFLFRLVHLGDIFAPVDPVELPQRLRAAGFSEATVDLRGTAFRFRARRE